VTLSKEERHVMAHATGWDSANPGYRNHFCASPGHDDWATLQRLCDRGLMVVGRQPSAISGGDTTFWVTDAGLEALKRSSSPPCRRAAKDAEIADAPPHVVAVWLSLLATAHLFGGTVPLSTGSIALNADVSDAQCAEALAYWQSVGRIARYDGGWRVLGHERYVRAALAG
jgi:hypothetical protein